jgi:hypothetical protein
MTVVALYVDAKGIYPQLLGPDNCWDETRDARLYAGPHPVVAHPPCQLWVNLAGHNFIRYTRAKGCPQPHLRPGNDGGCFARALECVRRFGGVLEHPAGSHAWSTFALTKPSSADGWTLHRDREWVCEVWQSAYGHATQKRTWLLYHGERAPTELNWTRSPGSHQCGWFDRVKPTVSKREASATPPAFAESLIALARQARSVAA